MNSNRTVSNKKRTLILINIIIVCVATTMLMTSLSTALPSIIGSLAIDESTGQWLISIYSLAMGITMPLTAFLIRRFPTKWLYVTGISIVAAGLIIAIISPSFVILLIGRIFQACGNGILMSMSQVILLTIYPPEKRGMAMGWYGLAVGAAPVFAPTLGGVLVDSIGWRSIFGMTLIVVAFALIMALAVFENVLENSRISLDLYSFIMSIFAFGGITLGVGNLASEGLFHITVYLPLIIGVVTAVLFVKRQLKVDKPFLNLRILTSFQFDLALIGSMVIYMILMGASVLMPLYVQNVRGFSATVSGLVLLPGAVVNAIVSPFAGRLYDRIGIKKLFIPGAILVVVGSIIMGFINIETTIAVSSVCYVIRSFAFGCLMMPLITWGTSYVDGKSVADATALLSSLRTIAGAIGSAVFVGVMTMAAGNSSLGGNMADMHGINIAFMAMAAVAVILVVLSILAKDRNKGAA